MYKLIPIIVLLILAMVSSVYSAGVPTTMYLRANPDTVIADGKSVTTISAEVRDSGGELVADGTQVSFSASLGDIQGTVGTVAGVARARLTTSTVVGTSTVSAWATQGGAIAEVKVEMLAPGTVISKESFMTIASDSYLVYDPSMKLFYASGSAKFSHRGLNISADEMQFDLERNTLKCRKIGSGSIKLVKGDRELEAELMCYSLTDMKGYAVVVGSAGKVERVAFRGMDLATAPAGDGFVETAFDFVDMADASIMVKAKSATVRPGDQIQFRKYEIYIDGAKVLSRRYEVLPLGGDAALASNYIGWGSNGLRLDVPFYYSLKPTTTGSLHLRRGQGTGWGFYSGMAGWSLDMVQDYTTPGGSEGGFSINGVNRKDWGVHWHHSQQFDTGSRIYSYVEFPAHKDIFGTLNYSKPIGTANLGVNLYGNKYKDAAADVSTDVYVQSGTKPLLGNSVKYSLLARTSYATTRDSGVGAGLQAQLYGKSLKFGSSTSLNSSFSMGHDWGGVASGVNMQGNASLMSQFGGGNNAGLIYSYTKNRYSLSGAGNHRLSGNLSLISRNRKIHMSLLSTYTIDEPASSTFANLSYQLAPTWRVNMQQTLQKFGADSYSDAEFGLSKKIKDQEMSLIYSQSKKKFRMEFTAARF